MQEPKANCTKEAIRDWEETKQRLEERQKTKRHQKQATTRTDSREGSSTTDSSQPIRPAKRARVSPSLGSGSATEGSSKKRRQGNTGSILRSARSQSPLQNFTKKLNKSKQTKEIKDSYEEELSTQNPRLFVELVPPSDTVAPETRSELPVPSSPSPQPSEVCIT